MPRRNPTPYAGANRIRFEGLRRFRTLSAPSGAPLGVRPAYRRRNQHFCQAIWYATRYDVAHGNLPAVDPLRRERA